MSQAVIASCDDAHLADDRRPLAQQPRRAATIRGVMMQSCTRGARMKMSPISATEPAAAAAGQAQRRRCAAAPGSAGLAACSAKKSSRGAGSAGEPRSLRASTAHGGCARIWASSPPERIRLERGCASQAAPALLLRKRQPAAQERVFPGGSARLRQDARGRLPAAPASSKPDRRGRPGRPPRALQRSSAARFTSTSSGLDSTASTTRRFCARPCAVWLSATGWVSP
jgi:uncharacterized low-complexity protein